jgi:hypothetical protein
MSSVLEKQRVHGHANCRHGGNAEDERHAYPVRAEDSPEE